ncbi:MAG: hypothetical protein H6745_20135 [Deltaproteobacteria bacterium]|nr:hypothetical protein [Deltaproteobacteria bacterium]
MRLPVLSPVLALALLGACAGGAPITASSGFSGAPMTVNIAALTLTGVVDAVWDVTVENEAGDAVITRRITSSAYGDSRGSASYVAACDAQTELGAPDGVHDNRVTIELVGLYGARIEDAGQHHSARPAGSLPFNDPGPLSRTLDCEANADNTVTFDVTVMRPANQGFFDIAIQFNDIFCSAKFDCAGTNLLFDSESQRSPTYVLGLSCAAGPGAATQLWMDDILISCDDGAGNTWESTIDPLDGDGDLCDPGSADGQTDPDCGDLNTSLHANGPVFQVAVYKGAQSEDLGQDVRYWNLGIGVTSELVAGQCSLSTKATADDRSFPALEGGQIAAGQVYPYIEIEIDDLVGCGKNPLSFGSENPESGVRVVYRSTGDQALDFKHAYPAN